VAALAGWHAATVSWDEPADGGDVTGYVVRALRGGEVVDEAVLGADAREHTFGALATGVTYTFEVVATNELGEGPAGGPATATPFRPRRPDRLDLVRVCGPSSEPARFRVENDNAFPVGFRWIAIPFATGLDAVAASSDVLIEVPRARRIPTVVTVVVDLSIQDVAVAC
jgi:hypothetical protein